MLRLLKSQAVLGLAVTLVLGCRAGQQPSLEETFKAVILAQRPPPPRSLAISAAAATGPKDAVDIAADPADDRELAAEALAAALVRSLSELLANENASAGSQAGRGDLKWGSIWERLTGGSLETLHATRGAGRPGVPDVRRLRREGAAAAEGAGAPPGATEKTATPAETRFLVEEGEGGGVRFIECAEPGGGGGGGEDFLEIDSTWVNVMMTAICVTCAGLAAGLTMGLLSIEPLEMAIKQRSGTLEEQHQATRILPLVSRHHFLLVTLLLFNSLANEALPIFLGNLVPSWLAVILSVSLVLFFGEIFPSAVFTGKNQLAIASGMSWFVYTLMMVLGPVAWPIAQMLDYVLGIEGLKRYNRAEISALVEVQHEMSIDDVTSHLPLHADEVSIVNGVLLVAEKSVSSAMITMDKVFCLGMNETLDANTMADIIAAGYSRVLVYEGEDTRNIRGYLQVKKLIVINPEHERSISSLMLRIPVVVSPRKSLLELLNTFQTGRSHLALVSDSPAVTLESLKRGVPLEGAARPVGIITLEDIIEEIIQEEIYDESDRLSNFIENRARDTLLRFAIMRRDRQSARQITPRLASLAAPRALKRLGSVNGPPSTSSQGSAAPMSPSYMSMEGGSSFAGSRTSRNASPLLSSLPSPAAPGLDERTLLLGNSRRGSSKSTRRRSPLRNSTRGRSTLGQSLLAAARASRENSFSSDPAPAPAGPRPLSSLSKEFGERSSPENSGADEASGAGGNGSGGGFK